LRKVYIHCVNCKSVKEVGICAHSQMTKNGNVTQVVFTPYYSEELGGVQVTSSRQEEKLLRKHGLVYSRDLFALRKKRLDNFKNREEVVRERYKKEGLKYVPKSNTVFNDKLGDFVNRDTKQYQSKRTYFCSFLLLLLCTVASAGDIQGMEYTKLSVNGVVYEVPLANTAYSQELFFLKKALKGDEEAMDMFLGSSDIRTFFIGDSTPRWIKVYRDGRAEVIENDKL